MKVLVMLSTVLSATTWLTAQNEAPLWPILTQVKGGEPLPGTKFLTREGDISRQLVDANDRFLDKQIAAAAEKRSAFWNRNHSSPEAYAKSVEPNRQRLIEMLGLHRDERTEEVTLKWSGSVGDPHTPVIPGASVVKVRWRAFGGVHGRGLLLEHLHLQSTHGPGPIPADIIAIPDADQAPINLTFPGDNNETSSFVLDLALAKCRVVVPALISREENRWTLTNREWLHRSAFMQGRTMTTYELQKIFALVDALIASRPDDEKDRPIGIIGHGEGGWLAMLAAAVDPRIDVCLSSGSFGPREDLWQGPVERNIFGLLTEFGDAEIASLIHPRVFQAVGGREPDWSYRTNEQGKLDLALKYTGKKGKPSIYPEPTNALFKAEFDRFQNLIGNPDGSSSTATYQTSAPAITAQDIGKFLQALGVGEGKPIEPFSAHSGELANSQAERFSFDEAEQIAEIERHNQLLLIEAAQVRTEYFKDLKTDSLENFENTIEPYREKFRTEVIGDFELPFASLNAHSRPYEEGPKTISYEVTINVFDDDSGDPVIAYGILTLPKDLDLSSGEKRPVVVCQHGLEGTPQQVISEEKYKAYKAFATRLAERGFITFAPQNGYRYFDYFRLQQFKAQSIGKTLFSIIVPQHQQITNWLADQPFVDGDRIAFYGLSYGGKSAMRIPPLVDRYCLSICSADFNEWVWKNAATDEKSLRYSYANKGEYEIFEWNLGGTFNYAEMGWLICPRPFMVERGHFDGVAPDETVAYEFAKIRNLYQARLGIEDKCEIEWFVGPHSINGEGSYRFLHKHLSWPEPK